MYKMKEIEHEMSTFPVIKVGVGLYGTVVTAVVTATGLHLTS